MARFGPRLFAQGLVGSSSACSRLYCLLLSPPVHFQTSPPLPTRCSLASASPPLAAPPFSSLTPTSLPRIRPFRIYLPLTGRGLRVGHLSWRVGRIRDRFIRGFQRPRRKGL